MAPLLRLPVLPAGLAWVGLAACQPDYSLTPSKEPAPKEEKQTPARYRIKRIVYEGNWAIGAITEFDYGSNGKVSQARYVGHDFGKGAPKGFFTYNAAKQLTAYDYVYPYADSQGQTGERTMFTYSPQTTDPASHR